MSDEESLHKLKFPNGAKVYDQMRRSDPQVSAVLQSVFNPIKSASWHVEPASESDEDKEIADFVAKNIFPSKDRIKQGPDYNKTFEETLHEILLYIIFGYSVMEKVYVFADGKVWLKKLSPRLPRTIKEFIYKVDSNDFVEAIQRVNGTDIHLPAKKIIIFTANKEGATLSGISYLRPVYKPFSIKTDLQRLQSATFERYGLGTPVGTLPDGVSSDDPEGKALVEALENVSSNETSYIVTPFETTVTMLAGGATTVPDMQSAIDYQDQQITISFLAQFLNLGVSSFGSRALGNTFVDFFTNSLEGVGDYIASRLNQQLVQELVDFNYSVEKYPKLVMSRIDSVDMDNMSVLSDAGLISSTIETENQLRNILRLKPITEEQYEKAHPVVDPNAPEEESGGVKDKKGVNPKGKGVNKSTLNKKDAEKQLSEDTNSED
jgi:phage gp29-like protein